MCWCIWLLSNNLPLINSLCFALALSAATRRRWMVLMSGFSCLETQLTLRSQGQADPSPSSVSLFDLQPFLLFHSARSAFNTRAEVSAGHGCRIPPPHHHLLPSLFPPLTHYTYVVITNPLVFFFRDPLCISGPLIILCFSSAFQWDFIIHICL